LNWRDNQYVLMMAVVVRSKEAFFFLIEYKDITAANGGSGDGYDNIQANENDNGN